MQGHPSITNVPWHHNIQDIVKPLCYPGVYIVFHAFDHLFSIKRMLAYIGNVFISLLFCMWVHTFDFNLFLNVLFFINFIELTSKIYLLLLSKDFRGIDEM